MSNKKQTSEAIAAVSVIIPIYNVEKYLSTCVYSVLKQSLKDIEVILVDDGSPDNCGQIADSIARKDARVKVIHRNNGGLGAARNSGLDCARGEYVCFIDSDDWIDNNMLEELHTNAVGTNADIVFSGMRIVASGNVIDEYDHPFHGRILDNKGDIFAFRRSFLEAFLKKSKLTQLQFPSALRSTLFLLLENIIYVFSVFVVKTYSLIRRHVELQTGCRLLTVLSITIEKTISRLLPVLLIRSL